jgi:hypothetical protein
MSPLESEIKDRLEEESPEAAFYAGYEDAIIGIAHRFGLPPLVAYNYEKCIDLLMQNQDMNYEDAVEWFTINSLGAWVGEGTPVFIEMVPRPANQVIINDLTPEQLIEKFMELNDGFASIQYKDDGLTVWFNENPNPWAVTDLVQGSQLRISLEMLMESIKSAIPVSQ